MEKINTIKYWNDRYLNGGNSGNGSYGDSSEYKARVINNIIIENDIELISDYGCGDGNQISLFKNYKTYFGYDVSEFIIEKCKNIFSGITNMFFTTNIIEMPKSDMCISLDVIYHLKDNKALKNYISTVFNKSNKLVVIYSTNYDYYNPKYPHVIHHNFSKIINSYHKKFELIETLVNPLENNPSQFYIYKKKKKNNGII